MSRRPPLLVLAQPLGRAFVVKRPETVKRRLAEPGPAGVAEPGLVRERERAFSAQEARELRLAQRIPGADVGAPAEAGALLAELHGVDHGSPSAASSSS